MIHFRVRAAQTVHHRYMVRIIAIFTKILLIPGIIINNAIMNNTIDVIC